jgi:RimJ/RimL family protein N-acetyltransferase
MQEANLTVREIQESDVPSLIRYWMDADAAYLKGMGADINKLPTEEEWKAMLLKQVQTPLAKKQSYCIIWLVNDEPVGHSNVNKIIFGKEAYMHLHIWNEQGRRKGYGATFVRKTLPFFFTSLHLQTLYCEPYAINPAPNKTLEKLGFQLVKEYSTVPGTINFEQLVKQWVLTKKEWESMCNY